MLVNVRCCCDPSVIFGKIGRTLGEAAGLELRGLDDGTFAFDSAEKTEDQLQKIPGFVAGRKKGGKKTWKKK